MAMLDVFGSVLAQIGLDMPAHVYGSSDRDHRELARLANIAANDVARSHDWQALRKLATLTGDGTTTAFDLPTDHDRRVHDANLWSSDLQTGMSYVESMDDWLGLQVRYPGSTIKAWTLYGGQIHTLAPMGATETAKYYYLTTQWGRSSAGAAKTSFTDNADSFVLDETILALAIAWRWMQARAMHFGPAKVIYDKELARLIARDKGPGIVRVSARRLLPAKVSDPWRLW